MESASSKPMCHSRYGKSLIFPHDCNSYIPGPFLDLLLEKVELMASNDLTTNLLVTSLLSQLASFPQPLLRSVLIHPDVILQVSKIRQGHQIKLV